MAIAQDAASDAPPLRAFALLWYATLQDIKHVEQLVKGVLLAGSLLLVYGESNSGKTFWLLDLLLAIARGALWRGLRTRRGLVVYVALESASSVRARVAAYQKENPNLGGLPFAIITQAIDLLSAESVEVLIATIRAAESECGGAVALVAIDTLARAMPGGDENSAEDMGLLVAAADRIRSETGACVALVHHAGKDPSKGARGSSALRAAADTEVLIEGQSGQRAATVSKQRDLESGERMPFELMPVPIGEDPDDGAPITSCVVKHLDAQATHGPVAYEFRGNAQRQLLKALRARSQTDIQRIWSLSDLRRMGREIGLSKGTARSAVDALAASPYMQAAAFGYRFTDGRVEG